MSQPDPLRNEVRKARRSRRVGIDAACVLCGESNPDVLIRVGRSVLEQHHVLGAAHAPSVTVPLCRNCHAIETERMRDAGISLERDHGRAVVEVIEIVLRAQALYLRSHAEASERFAAHLREHVEMLDRGYPGWRDAAETRSE